MQDYEEMLLQSIRETILSDVASVVEADDELNDSEKATQMESYTREIVAIANLSDATDYLENELGAESPLDLVEYIAAASRNLAIKKGWISES